MRAAHQQSPVLAVGIALQGIRVRLGRAVVTLTSIALGVAFLMATLTTQTLRDNASRESEARLEAQRMLSFLEAETGPLAGRRVGIVAAGAQRRAEACLIEALARARAVTGVAEPDCAAVIIVGDGATRTEGGLVLAREPTAEERAAQQAQALQVRFRTRWILAIALLVTGIGVANAMLMSVTERFREIGTLKCLGARSAFVRQIFFVEACVLGLTGALAGVAGGARAAWLGFAGGNGVALATASWAPGAALVQGAWCLAAGVALAALAAVYPAAVAARMAPAAALRSTV